MSHRARLWWFDILSSQLDADGSPLVSEVGTMTKPEATVAHARDLFWEAQNQDVTPPCAVRFRDALGIERLRYSGLNLHRESLRAGAQGDHS